MTKPVTHISFKDAVYLLTRDHKEVKKLFKEFEKLGDRAYVAKKNLADEICAALTAHTTVEEEIFYPALRKAIKDDDLMDEALVEHASAKELITQIQAMAVEDDLFDAKIKVLSEQIEHHVGEEEGKMFAKARKSGLDLDALGEEITACKDQMKSTEGLTKTGERLIWPYAPVPSSTQDKSPHGR